MEENGDVAAIRSETTKVLIKCDHLNNKNGGNLPPGKCNIQMEIYGRRVNGLNLDG
jgi:hypothetical protein